MTTLAIPLASLGQEAYVRCLDRSELLTIRADLDRSGRPGELVADGVLCAVRAALVDGAGVPLLLSDAEAEAFVNAISADDLGCILGAALAASTTTSAQLAGLAAELFSTGTGAP